MNDLKLKEQWQEFVEKQIWQGEDDYTKNIGVGNVADWWIDKVHQAEQEMLERVEEMRDAPPPYSADKENPMKHIYQNQGYARALVDLLSSLEINNNNKDD